jgi:very-short-patch-repair endonuclease
VCTPPRSTPTARTGGGWRRCWRRGGAAISHRAAAYLHELTYTGTRQRPELELVLPRGRNPFTTVLTIHTQVRLLPTDVVDLGVWRVTTVAWTLASLAHRLGQERLLQAVGGAIAGGKVTAEEFAACVPRLRWCPGAPLLRETVHLLSPELRLTRSEAERLAVRICVAAGLPEPDVNLRVRDASGRARLLDLAWPEWGVCVEIDVHPTHDGSIGRHLDGRRQNDLVGEWVVLRFDDLDLQFDADEVVAVIRRTLQRAGAEL